MTVKLLLTWDIAPDHEQDYFEFVISEFIPGVQRLGLQTTDAWATAWGNGPQIQVGMLAEDVASAQRVLRSEGWGALLDKLLALVNNYQYKIIPARGGFQF